LLLCPIHHDVVDNDPVAYAVERLLALKTRGEVGGLKLLRFPMHKHGNCW
jgi:hypothetical protein